MIKRYLSYILSFFLLTVLWTSCSLISGNSTSTYTIEVDSISVPAEVSSSDTLVVRPFGTVGPDGCHSFKQFEASQTPSSLDLQVIGEVVEGDDIACADTIVKLDTTYRVSPPLEGPFEINIHQPDESVLSHSVEVNN